VVHHEGGVGDAEAPRDAHARARDADRRLLVRVRVRVRVKVTDTVTVRARVRDAVRRPLLVVAVVEAGALLALLEPRADRLVPGSG